MCCFSGKVQEVSGTQIFARAVENGRQLLVYSMYLSTQTDVAMILPLPVPAGAAEDALRFISLKEYPEFFEHLKRGFPEPVSRAKPGAVPTAKAEAAPAKLEVVEVGNFEASFVPTVKDFGRLDARFRLPDAVWGSLPAYKDYGFAVFKLKASYTTVHPMAFEFPRADAKRLFFPTVHIHDGTVHDKARFDHTLYCQKREADNMSLPEWRESDRLAVSFMEVQKAQGIVDGQAHCYRKTLKGELKNQDTLA